MAKAMQRKLIYKLVVGTYATPEDFTTYCETMESLAVVYKTLRDYNLYLNRNQEIHIYNFVKVPYILHAAWLEWTTKEYKSLKDMIGID